MPTATIEPRPRDNSAIDWPGIRANAVTMGIRAAARAAASDLSAEEQERFVFRVLKRAARQGWKTAADKAIQTRSAQLTTSEKPLSSKVLNGSDSLATALANDNRETRLSLSKGVRRAAKYVETLAEPILMAGADKVHSIVKSAATLHGWEEKQQQTNVMVNLAILGADEV